MPPASLLPSQLNPVADWLLRETRSVAPQELLAQLAERLSATGIPVWRANTSIPTLHPQTYVMNLTWTSERGPEARVRPHERVETAAYKDSPVAAVAQGAPSVRCRLAGPDADTSYAICRELADAGATDYLCLPLVFTSGIRKFISWATKAPGGFTREHAQLLVDLAAVLALRLEIESARYTLRSLLDVYLGQNAAERVLGGAFKRGTGVRIRAAIWFCDLRGFTEMSDHAPADEVVAMLDRYFESVGGPIAEHGGEILKFIGDAVLAIFTVNDGGDAGASARALAAATGAVAAMRKLGAEQAAAGRPAMGLGIALHFGEVMYGNIGARDRLDFTVIGAAVNEACRVESMCKPLALPLLATRDFLERVDDKTMFRSVGTHKLKGVAQEKELFTVVP